MYIGTGCFDNLKMKNIRNNIKNAKKAENSCVVEMDQVWENLHVPGWMVSLLWDFLLSWPNYETIHHVPAPTGGGLCQEKDKCIGKGREKKICLVTNMGVNNADLVL